MGPNIGSDTSEEAMAEIQGAFGIGGKKKQTNKKQDLFFDRLAKRATG